MRTFEALHADALAAAIAANAAGNRDAARMHTNRAAEWHRLDEAALARREARGNGKGAHHG